MMNNEIKLNPRMFDEDVEKISTRKGFGEGLLEAGLENEQIVALCADLTSSTYMNLFRDKFPKRFIQIGVAEQNLITVASGMAAIGKIPFVSSYATFSPGRNWEQIRTTVCYNDRPVKIIGSHSGVSVGPDGGTHQGTEDIAITRVLPNMVVVSPCDYFEAKKATIAIAKNSKPSYLRLTRNDIPVMTTENTPFEIGKAQIFYEPEEKATVGIIATGIMVYSSIQAARELKEEGIYVKVLNFSTIKPADEESVLRLAEEAGAIVTAEDHQISGGLGSVVSEILIKNYPIPQEFVGINDKFGQSGNQEELMNFYSISVTDIKEAVKKAAQRKNFN